MSDISRRNVFHIIGAAPALAAVVTAETHDHMHMSPAAAAAPGPYNRQTFDDHQWQTVHVLCDLIIPADEQSGSASDAGVPEFIDDWIAFRAEQDGNLDLTAKIFGGLMWLDREASESNGKHFADLPTDQRKAILDRIAYPAKASALDHPWVPFFTEFRTLTVSGFFSSKMGVAYLPYLGNVAVEEWKGCDPKVWAIIEDRLKNGYQGGVMEAKPWRA
jgi:gluconate 2-dehydrogenase gamma chain